MIVISVIVYFAIEAYFEIIFLAHPEFKDLLTPNLNSYTVGPAITATLYNGHLSIAVTNEQSRPKFHNIEPVYSGHPFVVPY